MALTNEDLTAIADLMTIQLQPVHNRLNGIDSRLDKIEADVSSLKLGQEELRNDVHKLEIGQEELRNDVHKLEIGQEELRNDVHKLEIGQEELRKDVHKLEIAQAELKKDVHELKHKVDDTYILALDAWGQSTENREWLKSKKASS